MTARFDVIVVGLGGMGSAAAAHLARRGRTVLGLEQHWPAHDRGSSHGDSRIYRQAYFEHPDYVPLLLRAFELWRELGQRTGSELLTVTGGLMLGPPDSRTVTGSRTSAETWGLAHEMLDAAEVRARFPAFAPAPGEVALFEANAGFVRPEATVSAHLAVAAGAGADLRFGQRVLGWEVGSSGEVTARTEGERFHAERLVLSAGPWAAQVLAGLGLHLEVERQVQFWFRPPAGTAPFGADRFPVYVWDSESGTQAYGFPLAGDSSEGVKAALFRHGGPAHPDHLRRDVEAREAEPLRAFLRTRLPGLAGEVVRAVPCMYTNTPDEHFVIGLHPDHPEVALAAGFSGHGFKFVPVVGELLAELVVDGRTGAPITLFDPARLTTARSGRCPSPPA
jgi:sarcosine oxidase